MAAPTSFIGNEATLINQIATYGTGSVQPNALNPGNYEGRLRVSTGTITYATQAFGATVYGLLVLPRAARIQKIDFISTVTLGTATLALGLAAKDNSGFLDLANTVADSSTYVRTAAAAAGTALQQLIDGATNLGAMGLDYTTQKEVWLTLVIGTANLPASGTGKIMVTYTVD